MLVHFDCILDFWRNLNFPHEKRIKIVLIVKFVTTKHKAEIYFYLDCKQSLIQSAVIT